MTDIQESDWKYLRNLKKTLLDRLCHRILDDIQAECAAVKREPDAHRQYLEVYHLVEKSDRIVADCFDDWSRSKIFFKVLFLIEHRVITEAEVEQLSDQTKERIKFLFKRKQLRNFEYSRVPAAIQAILKLHSFRAIKSCPLF